MLGMNLRGLIKEVLKIRKRKNQNYLRGIHAVDKQLCLLALSLRKILIVLITGLDIFFLLLASYQHSENSIQGTLKATHDEEKIVLLKIEQFIAQTSSSQRYQNWRWLIKEGWFVVVAVFGGGVVLFCFWTDAHVIIIGHEQNQEGRNPHTFFHLMCLVYFMLRSANV